MFKIIEGVCKKIDTILFFFFWFEQGRSLSISIRIISIHYTTICGIMDRNGTDRNRQRPSLI